MTSDTAVSSATGGDHRLVFTAELGADATTVWNLIGAFESLPDWHPLVAECVLERDTGGAIVRRTGLHDGTIIRNRLIARDEAARSYQYDFVEGPLVVRNYRATLSVADAGAGRSRVEWISEFEADAEQAEIMRAKVESLIAPGVANLKKIFGG